MTDSGGTTELEHRAVSSYPSLLETFVARYEHDRMVFPVMMDAGVAHHFQVNDGVEVYGASQLHSGFLAGRSMLEPTPPPWHEGNIETFTALAREGLDSEPGFPCPDQIAEPWHRMLWSISDYAGTNLDSTLHAHYFRAVSLITAVCWGRPDFNPPEASLHDLIKSLLQRHRQSAEGKFPTAFTELRSPEQFVVDYEASVMVADLPPLAGWTGSDSYRRYLEALAVLESPSELSPPETGKDEAGSLLGWSFEDAEGYFQQVMVLMERAIHVPVWVIYNRRPDLNERLLTSISELGRSVQLYDRSSEQVFPPDLDHSILVAS